MKAILLADDEKLIRDLGLTFLEALGYKVIQAVDGKDAVSKFLAHTIYKESPPIEYVILDVRMPNMDGIEAYKRIRKYDSTIPILLCSGYTVNDDEISEFLDNDPNLQFKLKINYVKDLAEGLGKTE